MINDSKDENLPYYHNRYLRRNFEYILGIAHKFLVIYVVCPKFLAIFSYSIEGPHATRMNSIRKYEFEYT